MACPRTNKTTTMLEWIVGAKDLSSRIICKGRMHYEYTGQLEFKLCIVLALTSSCSLT